MKTITLQGKEYAQVKDRVSQFRKDAPNGSIETAVDKLENGEAVIKATIIFDLSDPNSKRSTGHAYGQLKGDKAFEKLETIAVGRALALLGYLTDGDIASAEEMEEFLTYKAEQLKSQVSEAIEGLMAAKDIEAMKDVWAGLKPEVKNDPEVIKVKEERKNAYSK